jgi:hypothetical protein
VADRPARASSTAQGAPDLRVFINYRRADTADVAGRLYDTLAARFGDDEVFMDIDDLEPGVDFQAVLNEAVEACDAVLAVIGRNWLTAMNQKGHRRLDDPDDYVRVELQTALERDALVIPLLVHGAEMPRSDELPPALRKLARRNALEMSNTRWTHDVRKLVETLEDVAEGQPGGRRWRRRRLAGIAAGGSVVVAAAVAGALALSSGASHRSLTPIERAAATDAVSRLVRGNKGACDVLAPELIARDYGAPVDCRRVWEGHKGRRLRIERVAAAPHAVEVQALPSWVSDRFTFFVARRPQGWQIVDLRAVGL